MAGMPPQSGTILKRQENPPAAGRRNPQAAIAGVAVSPSRGAQG